MQISERDLKLLLNKIVGLEDILLRDLVRAIIQVESAGHIEAESPVGAQGLMQLMPAMQKALGVSDPFDPEQNVRGGVTLLKEELKRFKDTKLALSAYNAGSPKVKRAISKSGLHDFDAAKPYLPLETQMYVQKVLRAI